MILEETYTLANGVEIPRVGLGTWLIRNADVALAELGYDEHFRRIWTLYLAYCEAGFAERRICDIQLLLTKPRSRLTSDDRPGSRGRTGPHDLAASA